MTYSKHYNWYQFQTIMKEYFHFEIRWGIDNILTISTGNSMCNAFEK